MVFKTLHWYIFRELLRIFVLTASALTTLMAFGGTFRPFTKNGIEILQLLSIMMNLMPAMLAYAIPIAALFAAVLVYWRLSTDNELTACRASGISFVTLVLPALVLGLAVASTDLFFVQYVVPVFLQRTERAVLSDLGSLLVSQIGRQENYKIGPWMIYADSAVEKDSPDPNSVVVDLHGMAATKLKNGKPTRIVIAREAIATITTSPAGESDAEATARLIDGAAFDEPKLQKISGSVDSLFGGEKLPIPSPLKSKPKFLNLSKLREYRDYPGNFPPVREIIDKIAENLRYERIGNYLYATWRNNSENGVKPVICQIPGNNPGTTDDLCIYAPAALLDLEEQVVFLGTAADAAKHLAAKPVRIDEYYGKKLLYTYTCDEARILLGPNELSTDGIAISLELDKNVLVRDHVRNIGPNSPLSQKEIPGIAIPGAPMAAPTEPPRSLLTLAAASGSPSMHARSVDAQAEITKLFHTITSELHSRASFSVSCLTLVLFGAALGILLRGRNPLAVFVVGFVPAVLLVLLITAGRQVAEGASERNVPIGLALIWFGNAILVVLVVSVYAKLLRH